MIVVTGVLLTTIPVWLLVAALLSPAVPGRLRPLRILWLVMLHLVAESLVLVELFGLWIASGFGLFIRRPFFERTTTTWCRPTSRCSSARRVGCCA